MSLWTFLYDMMKCRVSGTQWTITFSPTKLVSGASQWVTPGLFLSSSNSHTPAPSLCPLCHDNALLCITSWIGSWLRLTLGNALFVIKPTDGCLCLMGSHYIHHFTRTRLCNTFLTCSSPLTPDDGVKRASCPGEREERTCLSVTMLTAPWQEIADADTLSNVGESWHIVIQSWD